jgi:beta-glucanase (GH16 family)
LVEPQGRQPGRQGASRDEHAQGKKVNVPGVAKGFHTFAVWWKPDEHILYVDGKETWRTNAGGSICHVPQYILLSDEIGKWGGDITTAKLPDKFLVDYVRVYDLVDQK